MELHKEKPVFTRQQNTAQEQEDLPKWLVAQMLEEKQKAPQPPVLQKFPEPETGRKHVHGQTNRQNILF